MCGIFGIISIIKQNIFNKIINGLIQLQNRGYDSTGICLLNDNNFIIHKYASTNKINSIDKLKSLLLDEKNDINIFNHIGIGHNRWATHGIKNDTNAHPHISNSGQFVLVHNGIIENYNEIKLFLKENGYHFYSQTDTEVIVNLIEYYYKLSNNNAFDAIEKTINKIQGTYGLIIINKDENNRLYCVRNGSPLLIGQNEESIIITSEQSGFCNEINNYITLNNDDICILELKEDKLSIITNHTYLQKNVNQLETNLTPYPYDHWTLKEINEQPQTILNSINNGGRIKSKSEVKLGGLEQYSNILKDINNIILLGCGTSFFAAQYGMHYFKYLTNFNTIQVFDGAEFTDYDIPKIGKTAFILISQSGETKDLHRCIEIAKDNSIVTIGVINVVDSLIAREVDCGIYCNAGKEVGVASTKAFTSQVICLSLCAMWFSQLHNINENKRIKIISDLYNLSNDFKNTIEENKKQIVTISNLLDSNNMFLLGKGTDEFVAKEGSLKIKEISYIHSEGYSASSLKHGPFALLDENFPVILLNLVSKHKAKILNCLEEIHSRNAPIILITNDEELLMSNDDIDKKCLIIGIKKNMSYSSLLGIIPLQLLAYYLSINREINPDIPRNLAKVVTVE